MKVPLSWLKEYVDFDASTDEVADRLTMAAVDLEEVDELDDTERGAGGHGSTGLR